MRIPGNSEINSSSSVRSPLSTCNILFFAHGLQFLVSISAGVVFTSLAFAYSAWLRVCIWSFWTQLWASVLIKTGIYEWNLLYRRTTEEISRDTQRKVDRLKKETQKEVFKKRKQREDEKNQETKPLTMKKPMDGQTGSKVLEGQNYSSSFSSRFQGSRRRHESAV